MYIYGMNNLLGMYSACQKFDFLGHRHHEYERINLIELRYLSDYNAVVQSPRDFSARCIFKVLPGHFSNDEAGQNFGLKRNMEMLHKIQLALHLIPKWMERLDSCGTFEQIVRQAS
jgi:hypothetical protein